MIEINTRRQLMNLKELKELNETALISLNRYKAEKEEKNTADNGSIKDYYTAKHISAQIEEYNKVFEINATKLADEIKNFLEEKTGEKYSLNVVLDNKERREIADEFGNKFIAHLVEILCAGEYFESVSAVMRFVHSFMKAVRNDPVFAGKYFTVFLRHTFDLLFR